jgi:Fe-S oxidoreductase
MSMASEGSKSVLMVGCSYARHAPEVADAAVRVARRFVPDLQLAPGCCGLPLLHAGDRRGFFEAARALEPLLAGAHRVIAADPGCAQCLMQEYPRQGLTQASAMPLVDVLYAELDALPPRALRGRTLRYHDPCQLGRGLGRYEEPRAILARLTGAPPGELERSRGQAECSGGGGLLPLTRPDTSADMADERLAEHQAHGGGTLVTACGNSLRRLGSRSTVEVVDLITLVDEALTSRENSGP